MDGLLYALMGTVVLLLFAGFVIEVVAAAVAALFGSWLQ